MSWVGFREGAEIAGAAEAGDLAKVQDLVQRYEGVSVGEALQKVAQNGRLDIARFLVEEVGVDVNDKDFIGMTALGVAAEKGHLDIVRFLAEEHGADVGAEDMNRATALVKAAAHGHLDVVRLLTERCGADVDATDKDGNTALVKATEYGHFDVTRFLAEHGASVNAGDIVGYTALMWAAVNGSMDMVRLLVDEFGADVNLKVWNEDTVLLVAASRGQLGIVRFLVEEQGVDVNYHNYKGYTAVMKAVEGGHIDVVRFLADKHGSTVDGRFDDGHTALIKAAWNGHADVVSYLVDEHGADVAKDGETALNGATYHGHMAVVRLLVAEYGVHANTKNSKALMYAADRGDMIMVRFLAEDHNADVNAKDDDGNTALMGAADKGHLDIVRFLVEQLGAIVNAKNNDGDTAMMMASVKGHIDIVRFLAKQRSTDVNTKDNNECTALMKATANSRIHIVRLLANECDADVNVRAVNGTTAARLAADRGLHDIQRILTPLLSRSDDSGNNEPVNGVGISSTQHLSSAIPPSEVELTIFSQKDSIGGDFQAKWLDADAAVKLYIPDVAHSTFEKEVRQWQRLRHPNVTKMYGACDVGTHLQFFVCEYASQGSLREHIVLSSPENRTVWKYLHEAAMGLEYLHEQGIVYGDLRCSNILIGADNLAKLSNFGLMTSTRVSSDVFKGTMHWQSPEILEGKSPSYESDVFSLGMCILEAVTGEKPWGDREEMDLKECISRWHPESMYDEISISYPPVSTPEDPRCPDDDARDLVWHMCTNDPYKRASLSSVVFKLERLAIQESSRLSQTKVGPANPFDDSEFEELKEAWVKLQTCMVDCDNAEYSQAFADLKVIFDHMVTSSHYPTLFVRLHALATDLYRIVNMSSEQAQMMRLSSTRATTGSLYAFRWRVKSLLASLGVSANLARNTDVSLQQQQSKQIELFISGVADTFLVLQELTSVEERTVFLRTLSGELKSPLGKYTSYQRGVIKKAFDDIARELDTANVSMIAPEWFIPWYQLLVDEWDCLGEGAYGGVYRAKWLDSDVVVKRVILAGSRGAQDLTTTFSSLSASVEPSDTNDQINAAKRIEALAMFRREAEIWFGFNHPHVVRLFGACHVGRPFFVCEYATNGTLVSYLRKHPDDLWSRLHEAALGIQYLHARGVVHGDLKGNNIVIGRDLKAKVTDFGLSSLASSETEVVVSGAWNWVAPELFDGVHRPTFASDMYSLGMCIVEALRIVEAVKSNKHLRSCLPWRVADRLAVRHNATDGKLPSRPTICEDSQWKLVTQMCALDPEKRIKISTVVDKLARLATISAAGQSSDMAPTPNSNAVSWKGVTEEIAAARQMLAQLQDGRSTQGETISQYVSMWRRFERARARIDSNQSDDCRASFCSLVCDAKESTAKLQDMDGSLISHAQATMRCYALGRVLSKLYDAYFIEHEEVEPGEEPDQ
ncbi:unnamed protein product [Phytophthora fragariaefolia]|uniref:Unnamed protein product n=1 Tax=Phytophthora fragariaefolia TaxID=1490495 RepID=A0A9W7CUD4_9STRA|nr:unnamed protein product [Phytophthora fragariaefolia]